MFVKNATKKNSIVNTIQFSDNAEPKLLSKVNFKKSPNICTFIYIY